MSAVLSNARRVNEWERSFREAAQAGHPPDALRRYTADEVERFWSYTIAGVDEEHVYWDGPKTFVRNDGRQRMPARWVWERRHGSQLATHVRVLPNCGESNCIAPDHLELHHRERTFKYTDDQALGAMQVVAMRLGYPPTAAYWKDRKELRPSHGLIIDRWGSWERALTAAGLNPDHCHRNPRGSRWSDQDLVDALLSFVRDLGFVPSGKEWIRRSAGRQQPEYKTVARRLGDGSWKLALERAGLDPAEARSPGRPRAESSLRQWGYRTEQGAAG
jgi:hypothetical protein